MDKSDLDSHAAQLEGSKAFTKELLRRYEIPTGFFSTFSDADEAKLVHGLVDSFYFWPDIAIAFWLLVGVSELLELV